MIVYKNIENLKDLIESKIKEIENSTIFQYYVETTTEEIVYESKIVLENNKGIRHILKYILNAYDENMCLKANKNVKIIGIGYSMNFDY